MVVNDLGSDLSGRGADATPADETVAAITAAGGTGIADYHDVTDYDQAGEIVRAAVAAFGKLDVIVTNAGMDRRDYLYNLSPEDWRATIDVHVHGQFNCSAHAAKVMREQRSGSIINVTSGAFYMGVTRLGAYGASKGAIFGLMRTLSLEMERFGVRVNCVAPGLTQTRAVDHFLESLHTVEGMPKDEVSAFAATIAQPEDIAPIVVYLGKRRIEGRHRARLRDGTAEHRCHVSDPGAGRGRHGQGALGRGRPRRGRAGDALLGHGASPRLRRE